MEHQFPEPDIISSEDPDYRVEGLPKIMETQMGTVLGANKMMFGYVLDTKTQRKTAALILADEPLILYAPLTPASARRLGEHLIRYAEANETAAMDQLRELLSKPRDKG